MSGDFVFKYLVGKRHPKGEDVRLKGGPGSGHEGHAGRPGSVGGSMPGQSGQISKGDAVGEIRRGLEDLKGGGRGHLSTLARGREGWEKIRNAISSLGPEWQERYEQLKKDHIDEQKKKKGPYSYDVDKAERYAAKQLLKELK